MLLKSELKRKAIHLASLSIPIAYYLSPPSWTRTWERALLASVIVSLAIEVFRLHNPQIRGIFRHFFGEIVRNHEDASLLGSTYLLIAMLLTIHLFEKPVAVLALAFLVLGDTVAAIVVAVTSGSARADCELAVELRGAVVDAVQREAVAASPICPHRPQRRSHFTMVTTVI